MSWSFGAYTVPDADTPWYESTMPEDQDDNHAEATPIGATGTSATIVQLVNTPSIQAVLKGECGDATRTAILALRRTTFTIKTPFDGTGKSWYLKVAHFERWDNQQHQFAVAGAGERFLYTMTLVGR